MAKDKERLREILDALSRLDLASLERLHGLVLGGADNPADSGSAYLPFLSAVADSDVVGLRSAEKSYGNSWKKRGGVDTFNMLTRKWDRIEKRVATEIAPTKASPGAAPFDIFEHLVADTAADGFIDDVRDLRRYLALVEAEVTARAALGRPDSEREYLEQLPLIATNDVAEIETKELVYGNSWKRRGGIAAFMMFARKWDRIVQSVGQRIAARPGRLSAARENILEHAMADERSEGILDDVRDLRRYLLLVEAEMAARGVVQIGTSRDNRERA